MHPTGRSRIKTTLLETSLLYREMIERVPIRESAEIKRAAVREARGHSPKVRGSGPDLASFRELFPPFHPFRQAKPP